MWFIWRMSDVGRWLKRGGDAKYGVSSSLPVQAALAPALDEAQQPPPPDEQQPHNAPAASPWGPQGQGGVPTQGWHVLVAEDNALSRQVMGVVLQNMGHHASFATNGAEALAKVAAGGIDMVLMDIHMPVMDGLTSAQHIRALPGPLSSVYMVGLTADVHDDLVRRAQRAGIPVVLSKPLQKCELESVMATFAKHAEGLHPAGH